MKDHPLLGPHLSLTALATVYSFVMTIKTSVVLLVWGNDILMFSEIRATLTKNNSTIFSTVYGELPSEKDLDTSTGFFISGSQSSASKRRP